MNGKIIVTMYEGNRVEVESNFVDPEQIKQVLAMAIKACCPISVTGGFDNGKASADLRPKVRGDRKNHLRHLGFPR